MRRRTIARLGVAWGAFVFGLVFLAYLAAALADTYLKGGWLALMIALVVLSAIPALVVGVVYMMDAE